MAVSYQKFEEFATRVNYVDPKKTYDLNFEVLPGGSINDVFKKLKRFQFVGIADATSSITFNGFNLVAGIYDTPEEFMKLRRCIMENDRDGILSSFDGKGNAYALVSAFKKINMCLQLRGYECFDDEEIIEKVEQVCNSSRSK